MSQSWWWEFFVVKVGCDQRWVGMPNAYTLYAVVVRVILSANDYDDLATDTSS